MLWFFLFLLSNQLMISSALNKTSKGAVWDDGDGDPIGSNGDGDPIGSSGPAVIQLSVEVLLSVSVTAVLCLCFICVCWKCRTPSLSHNEGTENNSEELVSLRKKAGRINYCMSDVGTNDEYNGSDGTWSEETRFLKSNIKYFKGVGSDIEDEERQDDPVSFVTPRRSKTWSHGHYRSPRYRDESATRTRSQTDWPRRRRKSREELDYPDEKGRYGSLENIDSSHLDVLEKIAKGSFGTVVRAKWQREGESPRIVAVKLIKDEMIWRDELQLARLPSHPNVVKLLGKSSCRWEGKFGIVMPFYEMGNLKDFLKSKGSQRQTIEPRLQRSFMIDIAKGLEHLHKNRIVHRDIATRNILLEKDLHALISDFGFARTEDHRGNRQTRFGYTKWMAPEALTGIYSRRSDVYSFGMTCYEIIEQRPPFYDLSGPETIKCIRSGERPRFYRRVDIKEVLPGIKEIIERCWEQDKDDRPNMTEVVHMLEDVEVSEIYQSFPGVSRDGFVSMSSDYRHRSSIDQTVNSLCSQTDEYRSITDYKDQSQK